MSNLASVLKEEIRRLARQEARAEVATVRRSSGQYRRDIAALKRELAEARRAIAVLQSELRRARVQTQPDADEAEGRRWSARGLKAHRKRLGLSAKEYGALIGVSGKTIYGWESGAHRPRAAQLAAIVAIRGLGKRAARARLDANATPTNGQPRGGSRAPAIGKRELTRLLRAHEGNVSAVARELGKAPNQVHRWCRRHQVQAAAFR